MLYAWRVNSCSPHCRLIMVHIEFISLTRQVTVLESSSYLDLLPKLLHSLLAGLSQTCCLLLMLLMSIGSWALIIWKTLVLRRTLQDLQRAIPTFWDAASLDEGRARLGGLDREGVLTRLVDGARQASAGAVLGAHPSLLQI